ncbi:threonine aldolase family protein [Alteromonas sp. H39]|uniref:threonine aldolase family protein n=1 Tax=Alteromonas sp. H39 TaxID=3389876 RepID=UPI0039E128A2
MNTIPEALRSRYAQLHKRASAVIHRHKQASIKDELARLSKLAEADDERDTYGKGGVVAHFESELQTLFGMPACVFLPTGTLAQCVAVKCYSEYSGRSDVGLHPTSHLLLHEHNAIEDLWGIPVQQFGQAQRVTQPEDVVALQPKTLAAIIVESPMREIGGAMPSLDTLRALRYWCDEHDVAMHLDGARIWQTVSYYGADLAAIARFFDSIYVSFYKDLGGTIGAALLGSETLISDAKIWARRAGGNPITLYPDVLAARVGLRHHLPKMKEYIAYTELLSSALSKAGFTLIPDTPQAAMFHIALPVSSEILTARLCDYAEQTGVMALPLPRSGTSDNCICEVSVGDRALQHAPDFWVKHILALLP